MKRSHEYLVLEDFVSGLGQDLLELDAKRPRVEPRFFDYPHRFDQSQVDEDCTLSSILPELWSFILVKGDISNWAGSVPFPFSTESLS